MEVNKLSEKQINIVLDSICVLWSSLEQKNDHIIRYFDDNKIKHMKTNLKTGDYGLAVKSNQVFKKDYYIKNIVIERKNGLDEFANNITRKRQQFINEVNRASATNTKLIIMFERCPTAFKCKKCNMLFKIGDSEKCNCKDVGEEDLIYLFEDFYEEVLRGNYRSMVNPKSFYGSIMSFNHSHYWNNHLVAVNKQNAGQYIINTFKYYLRSRLKSLN
jgi:hypothetical protein